MTSVFPTISFSVKYTFFKGRYHRLFTKADKHMIVLLVGELYTVACSPTDNTLVATGGGDDKGFIWRIGQGDWAVELQGLE